MIYKWNAQEIIDHGDPWKVVVDLILQLSSLVELYYMCPEQFSPCLLTALHEWWPKYRLYQVFHYTNFDSEKLKLMTSPCLYSIEMSCFFASCESEAVFE